LIILKFEVICQIRKEDIPSNAAPREGRIIRRRRWRWVKTALRVKYMFAIAHIPAKANYFTKAR